jgi:hypothetical protein
VVRLPTTLEHIQIVRALLTNVRRLGLALSLLFGVVPAHAQTSEELQSAAEVVLIGNELAHSLFSACESHYRSLGFDPRYFTFFWDTARFEVLEGARLVLGAEFNPQAIFNAIEKPKEPPTSDRCARAVREDTPRHRIIPMATERDLQLMRDVYRGRKPDPHVARDKSLVNDCMKSNFNARQLDFDLAIRRCDCTLSAMHTVPSAELDAWLALSQSGAHAPMSRQSWFPELLPKLQACLVR